MTQDSKEEKTSNGDTVEEPLKLGERVLEEETVPVVNNELIETPTNEEPLKIEYVPSPILTPRRESQTIMKLRKFDWDYILSNLKKVKPVNKWLKEGCTASFGIFVTAFFAVIQPWQSLELTSKVVMLGISAIFLVLSVSLGWMHNRMKDVQDKRVEEIIEYMEKIEETYHVE